LKEKYKELMEKYKLIKQLGDGSYGVVTKAICMDDNEVVAIKKMKQPYYSWNECINLKEAKV
jgi:serine/threonine protein kinase